MKFIAAIEADFERGALGTPSRLRMDLAGETVLRRTLKRVLQARRLSGAYLIVNKQQEALAREAAAGLDVRVETQNAGPPPWQDYVASARKWSLDAWRGGVASMTVFDEAINPWVLESLARREGARGVALVPAAAALIDPVLLDDMLAHFENVHEQVRMVFTQSPPGLSAAIYAPELLADLAKTVQPPGRTMTYRPTEPHRDMIMQPCYYSIQAAVYRANGRLIVDTAQAHARVQALCEKGVDGLARIGAELQLMNGTPDARLPGEVEIELTTEDSLPASTLRPRGPAVGRRGPIDEVLFGRLVDELAGRDDARVVLGGFGDPLLHPNWPALVAKCRTVGILGLAIRTSAVELDERAVEVLSEHRVDVLNVLLDAATPETYARVHGADCFERVTRNIERVLALHENSKRPWPLLVCEMTKTWQTMSEIETFYDSWINKAGTAVITGPSAHAGRWPDLNVMKMAPPARFACGRVFRRAMVLADGRMTACDQDFRGEHAIGSLVGNSLADLWSGPAMQAVRQSELSGAHDATPLCPACEEWHRP